MKCAFVSNGALGKPAQFRFQQIGQTNAMATIEVQALDGNGVLCLDGGEPGSVRARGRRRCSTTFGTSRVPASCKLYNGRAQISLHSLCCPVAAWPARESDRVFEVKKQNEKIIQSRE